MIILAYYPWWVLLIIINNQAELGKLLFKSNILHITSYFIMDVVYYSYLLLKIQCNLLILHIKLLNKSNLILYYKLFVSKHILLSN